MPSKTKKKEKPVGAPFFIPGGLFVGFGLGFIFNNIPAGMFLGLGIGFILFGISIQMSK